MISLFPYDVDLENRPETYKTILKEKYGSNTETSKIRRKISKAVRIGAICSRPINVLDRGRDVIFFNVEKEYFIVYTKTSCFYCKNIESGKTRVILVDAHELNCVDWVSKGTLKIEVSEVVLCF